MKFVLYKKQIPRLLHTISLTNRPVKTDSAWKFLKKIRSLAIEIDRVFFLQYNFSLHVVTTFEKSIKCLRSKPNGKKKYEITHSTLRCVIIYFAYSVKLYFYVLTWSLQLLLCDSVRDGTGFSRWKQNYEENTKWQWHTHGRGGVPNGLFLYTTWRYSDEYKMTIFI